MRIKPSEVMMPRLLDSDAEGEASGEEIDSSGTASSSPNLTIATGSSIGALSCMTGGSIGWSYAAVSTVLDVPSRKGAGKRKREERMLVRSESVSP